VITDELKRISDSELSAKLDHANPMVLRALVYHATGDTGLRDEVEVDHVLIGWVDTPLVTDERSRAHIKEKALKLLGEYRRGERQPPTANDRDRLLEALKLGSTIEVPKEELDFLIEELAIEPMPRAHEWRSPPKREQGADFHIAVIGCGLGGVNAAAQLKHAGLNFTVFDKNAGPGGVWFQNKYPGARVDSPSRIYSNTWAVDYEFKNLFATQQENQELLEWSVDKHQLRDHIRFSTEVLSAIWIEPEQLWELQVRSSDGREETHRFNVVISAVGFLDRPSIPEIPGADSFEGRQMHTARYDNSLDLSGKRVALIGSGASGMQIIPDIADRVEQLTVYARSIGWTFPTPGYRNSLHEDELWLERNVPLYRNWERVLLALSIGDHTFSKLLYVDPEWTQPGSINKYHQKLRESLQTYLEENTYDRPDLYDKLLPDFMPLAKRFILDYGFLEALHREHVELVRTGIQEIRPHSIVAADGVERPTDVIIYATGFKASDYLWPMKITGRDGITLDEVWAKDGARAYWGITIPHMPNLFCIYGPNTNPTNTGPVQWGEFQTRYAMQCIEEIVQSGCGSLEVREDAYNSFNAKMDSILANMIYDRGTKSYYTNQYGRSATQCPWRTFEYWRATRRPDFEDYIRGTDGAASERYESRAAGQAA
jgi:4-hydroxyacetophenone monooxygenase